MWPVGVLRQKRVAQNSADVSMAREATDGLEHAEVEMPMVSEERQQFLRLCCSEILPTGKKNDVILTSFQAHFSYSVIFLMFLKLLTFLFWVKITYVR